MRPPHYFSGLFYHKVSKDCISFSWVIYKHMSDCSEQICRPCTIGLPDIPWIIPPVKSRSLLSVTFISMLLLSVLLFLYIFVICTSYSFLTPFSIFRTILAGPVFISSRLATSMLFSADMPKLDKLDNFP